MKQSSSFKIASKLQDYKLLIKFNLSFMVVFSAVISYLLAPRVTTYDWKAIMLLFTGGMLVTGSANAINQVVERDTDAMMKRTAGRPIAAGRMSVGEGVAFALIAGIGGTLILYHFNLLTALLSVLSLFVYAFIYTPLKKVSAVSVLVGAVPGSLPCLIGWAAGTGEIWLVMQSLGQPLGVVDAFILESLSSGVRAAAFMIPGALGALEGSFVLFGALFGLPADTALAISLSKRVRELALGLPGLVAWHWIEGHYLLRRSEPKAR